MQQIKNNDTHSRGDVQEECIKECAEIAMLHDGYIGLKINQLLDQIK